jgi:class 3 adenylate cyclase
MAVFRSAADALTAMLEAQRKLAQPAEGTMPLTLKAGLHTGPCIAVTLNDRLDYFGSTVNMAARLEGLSTGSDVIISGAVHDDPRVRELIESKGLSSISKGLSSIEFDMALKGFEDERFELWRVSSKNE